MTVLIFIMLFLATVFAFAGDRQLAMYALGICITLAFLWLAYQIITVLPMHL